MKLKESSSSQVITFQRKKDRFQPVNNDNSRITKNKRMTKEITLENGRVYLASISPVEVDEKKAGKVCILHDVTDYKALEKMKTEFVTTVSHDLQSPLAQLKGYASMLPMLGDLNGQQKEFNDKSFSLQKR